MSLYIEDLLLILLLFSLSPAFCYLATRLGERHQSKWYKDAKKEIADEWVEIADGYDELVKRQGVVTAGEQALRRRAKEVEAAVAAMGEQVDTEISGKYPDDLPRPNPHENADTVVMPAVRDATVALPTVQLPVAGHGFCVCESIAHPARDCGIKAHRELADKLQEER